MGHVPHGRDSKYSPQGLSISASTAASQRFHATDYRALDRSRMPQRKPSYAPGHGRTGLFSCRMLAPSIWLMISLAPRSLSPHHFSCSQACPSWAIGGISAEQKAALNATACHTGALPPRPLPGTLDPQSLDEARWRNLRLQLDNYNIMIIFLNRFHDNSHCA